MLDIFFEKKNHNKIQIYWDDIFLKNLVKKFLRSWKAKFSYNLNNFQLENEVLQGTH